MDAAFLAREAETILHRLCLDLPTRATGTPGNRAATDFFAAEAARRGFAVEQPAFDCLGWTCEAAALSAGAQSFEVFAGPFSPALTARAELAVAATLADLETANAAGKFLLLVGDLAREPLVPRNYPFYNVDEHQAIYRQLDRLAPLAVFGAPPPNQAAYGELYPLPLIEDGDFTLPTLFLSAEEGARLATFAGQTLALDLRAQRTPARGCNVIARRGGGPRRLVFTAHIDAKPGTPGALDNASGAATLLLLGSLLRDYSGPLTVELAALNGEDYYSAPGELLYLKENEGRLNQVALAVNMDGLGGRGAPSAWSTYACPPALEEAIRAALTGAPGLTPGEAWFAGDHMVFVMNGVPALALTSANMPELMGTLIHTAADRVEEVDLLRLGEAALALRALVEQVERAAL